MDVWGQRLKTASEKEGGARLTPVHSFPGPYLSLQPLSLMVLLLFPQT